MHTCDWLTTSRFCGRCGTATRRNEKERSMACPSCALHIHPRISPSYGSFFTREPNTTQAGAWIQNFGSVSAGSSRTSTVRFRPYYYGYYAGSWTFESQSGMPFCNGTPKLRVQGAVYP